MINAKNYWDDRYSSGGNSGYGSYGEQLGKKLNWLSKLEDIETITEIGCGDFHFGNELQKMYPLAQYTGFDISEVIIKRNKEKYPYADFEVFNWEFPKTDLLLCIDVLFHILDDSEYDKMLDLLEASQSKYLAVTAYEYDRDSQNHVRHRKFDYRRFGEPLIREIVEEDGELYFYLFKRNGSNTNRVDFSKVSCCLNTKENVYPQEILNHLNSVGFGEILIKTHSNSPYCKFEMFEKAKYDTLYYQDDDALCPVKTLEENYQPDKINVIMKPSHFESYSQKRMTMGLGWGCLFDKKWLKELKKYTEKYGEDDVFKRDTEKLLTHLVGPENQNRIMALVQDLPSAMAPGRLSMESNHYTNMDLIEERCKILI